MQRRWPSVEKARRLLGWGAASTLEEGSPQTVEWLPISRRAAIAATEPTAQPNANVQPRELELGEHLLGIDAPLGRVRPGRASASRVRAAAPPRRSERRSRRSTRRSRNGGRSRPRPGPLAVGCARRGRGGRDVVLGRRRPASREAAPPTSSVAAPTSAQPGEQRGASDSRKLAFAQPKLSRTSRAPKCSVKIVSADPIGRPNSTSPPGVSGAIRAGRSRAPQPAPSSARRSASGSRTAAAAGRPRRRSRALPPRPRSCPAGPRGRGPPVTAIRFVLPGLEPIPSIASNPARSKLLGELELPSVIQYRPPRSR